jgi:glycosyltransferase involved in cell wall biosynthesis
MKLVVIIPALNEAATIADVVGRVPRRIPRVDRVDVVVVDDGSSDATSTQARAAGADDVLRHAQNQGVGAAFASGMTAALARGADVVVNMDGDGQFRPEDIPKLIRPIIDGEAGFVTCTRFADPDLVPQMPAVKRWGNHGMTWLIGRMCPNRRFTDVSCGFRAYSRDTLLRLNLYGRYTYTQETFINLAAHDVAMAEVPLEVRGIREHGESRVASSISKYVANTVPIIFRTMRDMRPFAFFGSIAAVTLTIGIGLGLFVFVHWMMTGHTQPYRSVVTGSAVGIILGFLLFVVALLADMLNRLRKLLEDLLYFARRDYYDRSAEAHNASAEAKLPATGIGARNERTIPTTLERPASPARGSAITRLD